MTADEQIYNLQRAYLDMRDTATRLQKALTDTWNRQWVFVDDCPPPQNLSVLICDMDGDIYISHRTYSNEYYNEIGDKIKGKKAWMPLPKPWKEDNNA